MARDVAQICASSKQTGSALAVVILLATWQRSDLPTREEVASLIHVTPRQADRILEQLVASGEIEVTRSRGQGRKNLYQFNTTSVSDKAKAIKPTSVSNQPEVNTTPMSNKLSDVDVQLNPKDDADAVLNSEVNTTPATNKAEFNTTPVSAPPTPPYKDSNLKEKNKSSPTVQISEADKARFKWFVAELGARIALPSNMGAQGKSIKYLMKGSDDGKWTDDECVELLQEQLDDAGRTYAVSWLTVEKQIGTWAYKRRNPQKANGNAKSGAGGKQGGSERRTISDSAREMSEYFGLAGAKSSPR